MKARAREKEMNKRSAAREVVTVCSCPAFDAYLSAKKWPIAEQESKAMFTRLDKEMRARFESELRNHVLSPLAIVPPRHARVNLPPVLKQVVKRTRQALGFRLKKMVAKVSSRRRLLGESGEPLLMAANRRNVFMILTTLLEDGSPTFTVSQLRKLVNLKFKTTLTAKDVGKVVRRLGIRKPSSGT
ncbi:MAG: hypothetical protein DMC59_08365 [Verrucomicrobia bacterium]|nr:MAG: hypothetical protein DMC59_08365 [Verrucomicrobiota bacterium]